MQGKDTLVRLIQLEENQGVSYARNVGINAANSEWIMFLDVDDFVFPNLLNEYHEALKSYPHDEKGILIHSAYKQIDEHGNIISDVQRFKQAHYTEILGYQFIRNHVCLSGTMVKKDALLQVGCFNENIRYCEDWDLWIKIASIGGFIYIDKPLFHVRRHGSNASAILKNMLDGERKVLSQYSIDEIYRAISYRRLPKEENEIDFVSLLFRLEMWEEGYNHLQEIKLNNTRLDNKLNFYKGLYFAKNNQWQLAADYFKVAIEKNTKDGASINNLGVVLVMLENVKEAKECFNRAVSLFPGYLDADQNLKQIESSKSRSKDDFKITERPLRPVLINYKG